jgi:hypothetical protein
MILVSRETALRWMVRRISRGRGRAQGAQRFSVCKTLAKAWHFYFSPPPPDVYVEYIVFNASTCANHLPILPKTSKLKYFRVFTIPMCAMSQKNPLPPQILVA